MRGLARPTVRAYASSVAAFCRYVTDPAYGWAEQCQARFGTHPVQVAHERDTAVHVQEGEADPRKRAYTLDELQALFDHADAQVCGFSASLIWLPELQKREPFRSGRQSISLRGKAAKAARTTIRVCCLSTTIRSPGASPQPAG